MFMLSISLTRMSTTIFRDTDDERHPYFTLCFKGKASDTFLDVVPSRSEIHWFYPQGLLWFITTTRNLAGPLSVWHKAVGGSLFGKFAFSRILNLPQISSLQGWSSPQSLFTGSLTSGSVKVRHCTLFCKPHLADLRAGSWHWTVARLESPSIALDQRKQ